jgi:hypothetical protein
MIIISLSVRGVEHASKILSLKILIILYKTKNYNIERNNGSWC